MNDKKCKLIRKIARITSGNLSKETLYYQKKNKREGAVGTFFIKECNRSVYLELKKVSYGRSTTITFLKTILKGLEEQVKLSEVENV